MKLFKNRANITYRLRPSIVLKDTFILLLFLIAFTLPVYMLYTNILIGILAFCSILIWFTKKKNRKRPPRILYLLISLYLVNIFSLLYTNDFGEANHHLEVKLSILIFPFLFYYNLDIWKNHLRKIFSVFVCSIVAFSIICLSHNIFLFYNSQHQLEEFFLYYYSYTNFSYAIKLHPTFFALYSYFSIIILSSFFLNKTYNIIKRIIFVILVVYLLFIIIQLSSRIILLTLFVSIFIFPFLISNKKVSGKVILFVCLVFCLLITAVLYNPFLRYRLVADTENDLGLKGKVNTTSSSRILRWECALAIIKDNLIFGVGTGDGSEFLLKCYRQRDIVEAYNYKYNAHNEYLSAGIRSGVLGMLILVLNLFVPLFISLKKRFFVYSFFIISIIILCLTESMLSLQKGVVFYSFFNSLSLFFILGDRKERLNFNN